MVALASRRGEKIGWTWGWIGGFVWLLVLGGLWLGAGRYLAGGVALGGFAAGVAATMLCAPWRHPRTPYWRLLLPVYGVLFAAIGLILFFGAVSPGALGLRTGNLFLLLPMLLPFVTLGQRRWDNTRP